MNNFWDNWSKECKTWVEDDLVKNTGVVGLTVIYGGYKSLNEHLFTEEESWVNPFNRHMFLHEYLLPLLNSGSLKMKIKKIDENTTVTKNQSEESEVRHQFKYVDSLNAETDIADIEKRWNEFDEYGLRGIRSQDRTPQQKEISSQRSLYEMFDVVFGLPQSKA